MRKPETKLERHVARWLMNKGTEYDNKEECAYDDLMQGGCQSGIVGHLIYHDDTCRFFLKHRAEINALLAELLDGTGCTIPELFRYWEKEDPLATETNNRNILAWFGFEETARKLMETEE